MDFWNRLFARKGQKLEVSLLFAIENDQADDVMAFLDQGGPVNLRNPDSRDTVLMWAAERGHQDIVDKLLEKGAEVDAKNLEGTRALMCAAAQGHTSIVKKLIEVGANVDAQTSSGQTALMRASARGHIEVVELLLECDASINLQDEDGTSALYFAANWDRSECCFLLLEKGAEIVTEHDPTRGSMKSYGFGDTEALLAASKSGDINAVIDILSDGVDVNAQDDLGNTALIWSFHLGHDNIVELLHKPLETRANDPDLASELERLHSPQPAHPHDPSHAFTAHHTDTVLFLFDTDVLDETYTNYGTAIFQEIWDVFREKMGLFIFADGDLEVAAGGTWKTLSFLQDLSNEWAVVSVSDETALASVKTSPRLGPVYFYAILMYDTASSGQAVHEQLSEAFGNAYQGCMLRKSLTRSLGNLEELQRKFVLVECMEFSNCQISKNGHAIKS